MKFQGKVRFRPFFTQGYTLSFYIHFFQKIFLHQFCNIARKWEEYYNSITTKAILFYKTPLLAYQSGMSVSIVIP